MEMTITQIAAKYNLTTETLRYYERIGLLPEVPRQSNGNRYYPEELQDWIEMIICLRHSGVKVEALIDFAKLLQQGDSTLEAREAILKEQLDLLLAKQRELTRSIDRLQHKIGLYESGEIRQHKNYFKEYNIQADSQPQN